MERSGNLDKREFQQLVSHPIPAVDAAIIETMFDGSDKGWKKLPVKELISETPKSLSIVPNINNPGKAMARPAYYKDPSLPADKSGFGELAYQSTERLQLSPIVKIRPKIKDKLDTIQSILDAHKSTKHLKLVVVDGYRTQHVQAALFEQYKKYLRLQNPKKDKDRIDIEAQKMVSKPSFQEAVLAISPPPHSTGGSVDVILVDKNKIDITTDDWLERATIDFGSQFDEMMHPVYADERSCTRYFENMEQLSPADQEARDNRRLLYNLMINQGFTNYHNERRHFDFGNQFYAAYKGLDSAQYGFAGGVQGDKIIDNFEAEEDAYRFKKVGDLYGGRVLEAIDFGIV